MCTMEQGVCSAMSTGSYRWSVAPFRDKSLAFFGRGDSPSCGEFPVVKVLKDVWDPTVTFFLLDGEAKDFFGSETRREVDAACTDPSCAKRTSRRASCPKFGCSDERMASLTSVGSSSPSSNPPLVRLGLRFFLVMKASMAPEQSDPMSRRGPVIRGWKF